MLSHLLQMSIFVKELGSGKKNSSPFYMALEIPKQEIRNLNVFYRYLIKGARTPRGARAEVTW